MPFTILSAHDLFRWVWLQRFETDNPQRKDETMENTARDYATLREHIERVDNRYSRDVRCMRNA